MNFNGHDEGVGSPLQGHDAVHLGRVARHGVHGFDLRADLAQVHDRHVELLADALEDVLLGDVAELDQDLPEAQLLPGLLLVLQGPLDLLLLYQALLQEKLSDGFARRHSVVLSLLRF
jgi:hypothetical protein